MIDEHTKANENLTKRPLIFRIARELKSPLSALAKIAQLYIYWESGFSYDFKRNGEKRLIQKLQPFEFRTVFDVGANVGQWSEVALSHFPYAEVHAFEISNSNRRILEQSIKSVRFFSHPFGLGASNGQVDYNDFGDGSPFNSMVLRGSFHNEHLGHDLSPGNVRSGDIFCSDAGIEFIDLLKIDVEGAEQEVLLGFANMLRRHAIRVIQFEYGYHNGDAKFLMRDFYDLFSEHGYEVAKLRRAPLQFRKWKYSDNDFTSGPNYVAVHRDDLEIQEALSQKFNPRRVSRST